MQNYDLTSDEELVALTALSGGFGQLLSAKHVADRLGIQHKSIYERRVKNNGPPYLEIGPTRYRYPEDFLLSKNVSLFCAAKAVHGSDVRQFCLHHLASKTK